MRIGKYALYMVFGHALFAEPASAPAPTVPSFPAYPVPDEIVETPAANSIMMYGGVHVAAYQNTGIPGMLLGLSFFLRDFFSIRAELIAPLKKSALDTSYSGRATDLERNEPVLCRAGGNIRFLKISAAYFYLPALAGLELNRNSDEKAAAQTFVDLGLGAQLFVAGLYFLQLEYTYHFSNIPLKGGYYLDHNFHGGAVGFGIFF